MATEVNLLLAEAWERLESEERGSVKNRVAARLERDHGITYRMLVDLRRAPRATYDPRMLRRVGDAMGVDFNELRRAAGWGD